MTPNSKIVLERQEVCVYSDSIVKAGQIVKVSGQPLAVSTTGLDAVVTVGNSSTGTKMATVCIGGLCQCYCSEDPGLGCVRPDSNMLGIPGGASIKVLASADASSDTIGGTDWSLPSGTKIADVCINQGAYYSGYFTVTKISDTEAKVHDGQSTSGCPALINGEDFTVAVATKTIAATGTYYIYLQGTSTGSTINTPTIEVSTTLPTYEEGKCKVLLARVIEGVVVQEHSGMVQGIIWGDCDS